MQFKYSKFLDDYKAFLCDLKGVRLYVKIYCGSSVFYTFSLLETNLNTVIGPLPWLRTYECVSFNSLRVIWKAELELICPRFTGFVFSLLPHDMLIRIWVTHALFVFFPFLDGRALTNSFLLTYGTLIVVLLIYTPTQLWFVGDGFLIRNHEL